MPAIRRLSDAPYRWDIVEAPLSEVANQEKLLPPDFISADGLRHHRDGPPLLGATYRWRSLSAIQGWATLLCEAAKRGCAEETGCGVRRLSTRISRKSKPDFAFHLKKSTVAAIPEGQAGPGHVILTRCGDGLMSRAASGGRPRTDHIRITPAASISAPVGTIAAASP
jgi:hypothetical protein